MYHSLLATLAAMWLDQQREPAAGASVVAGLGKSASAWFILLVVGMQRRVTARPPLPVCGQSGFSAPACARRL